jgi:hypothetical protein
MAGGYQAPKNPAAVSGPGALSKRTDGTKQAMVDLPDAQYGEQGDFQNIQAGAPMASSGMNMAAMLPEVTGLGAATQRPDEPITAGIDRGPGIGSAAAGLPVTSAGQSARDAQQLAQYMPSLEEAANRPGAPKSFIRFVRYLRAMNA